MINFLYNNQVVFSPSDDTVKPLTWKKLVNHVSSHSSFNEMEKEEMIAAYEYIKNKFGQNFLKHSAAHKLGFGNNFSNWAPWMLRWSVWLSNSLKIAESIGNDQFIINKLKSRSKYQEGIAFLESLDFFHHAGFDVTFDEEITNSRQIKKPDIKLVNRTTNEVIFAELSELNESDENGITKGSFFIIANALSGSGLLYCGSVKHVEKKELLEVLQRLEQVIVATKKKGGNFEYQEWPFDIRLGIREKYDEFNVWCKNDNFESGLTGDKPNFEGELNRIRNKIDRESKQLIVKNDNLIIIHAHAMLFIGVGIIRLLQTIADHLKHHENILGVLVYGHFSLRNTEDHVNFQNHVISTRVFEKARNSTFLFIRNNFQESNLSEDSLSRIYRTFRFGEELVPPASKL